MWISSVWYAATRGVCYILSSGLLLRIRRQQPERLFSNTTSKATGVENPRQISHFLISCKIRGELDEMPK